MSGANTVQGEAQAPQEQSQEEAQAQAAHEEASACVQCGKPDATKKCSRCLTVKYCSRECQVESWPAHKATCQKPPGSEMSIKVSGPFRMGQQTIRIKPSETGSTLLVRYVRALLADPNDPNRRILDMTNGLPRLAPRGQGRSGVLEDLEASLESQRVKDGDLLEVVMVPVPGGGARGVAMTPEECDKRNAEWLQEREHVV